MMAWTDYPITQLGDKPYTKAEIREVEVLAYDRNKYCTVKVEGVVVDIKSGYIYKVPGRLGEVECVPTSYYDNLPSEVQK